MPDTVKLASRAADPVLVVGSVAFDNIVTPFSSGERILGGSASYASLAASYYAPARLVGVVGNDFEESFIERFRARGIDLAGLQVDKSGPTFFWKGEYHENFNQRDTLDIQLNVFEKFRPDLPEGFPSSPLVLLGNIHPNLQQHVLDNLEGKPFVAADTIDLWIKTTRDELRNLISQIDLFIINDSEAELLADEKNPFLAAEKIRKNGPKSLIIKKGEHGALLFHDDGLFAMPAYPVTLLRDPTGAGDAFAGALLGYLAAVGDTSFKAIKQAMVYATVTASMTVEAFSCDALEKAGIQALADRAEELRKLMSLD